MTLTPSLILKALVLAAHQGAEGSVRIPVTVLRAAERASLMLDRDQGDGTMTVTVTPDHRSPDGDA